MDRNTATRLGKLYKSTVIRSYLLGFVGFIVGVKFCDLVFYDSRKHEVEIELMEE
jgi:hypothetical protein